LAAPQLPLPESLVALLLVSLLVLRLSLLLVAALLLPAMLLKPGSACGSAAARLDPANKGNKKQSAAVGGGAHNSGQVRAGCQV
jgi:hypothetical protein